MDLEGHLQYHVAAILFRQQSATLWCLQFQNESKTEGMSPEWNLAQYTEINNEIHATLHQIPTCLHE